MLIGGAALADEGKDHEEGDKGKEHAEVHESKASGEGHGHKAPHGGMVITVDSYHYEMVVKAKEIRIYLLDNAEKTLPVDEITGNLILSISKKPTKKITLESKKDHLTAGVDLAGVGRFTALVSLKVDGKSRTGRFTYQMPEQEEAHENEEKAHSSGHHH
jgi:hypothetical protein